jgi:hypothetical protein
MLKFFSVLFKESVQSDLMASNSNAGSKHAEQKRPNQIMVINVFLTI